MNNAKTNTMNNGQINQLFLNSISNEMQSVILTNIAKHYGITTESVKLELFDQEAENVMDYITGTTRAAVYTIYKGFISTLKK